MRNKEKPRIPEEPQEVVCEEIQETESEVTQQSETEMSQEEPGETPVTIEEKQYLFGKGVR